MENNPVITNAEWIILRILLNKSPLGSRDILASVQKSNQWSSATVKTFLARLVLKKAISYHKDKNAFLYYPLVTEMMYVRNETKSFFAKIYGGTITYESNHFQFFGSDCLAFVINLANALEANYSRISADFAYQQTQKQMVYIHSSLKVMHSALGYENGPDWMTAG
ncbi:MAG: BlaI/MecI/CopY family transcriptional regulator, partial [Candidatus Izemoplasmatales bacterium]